ncbi:hypothetical protein C8J57DRAFT_1446479 [Mycena rebaudengoi]|nr:hypothetical protein C8J57DRAFT_1446479 [Mycena rebaudengoi]
MSGLARSKSSDSSSSSNSWWDPWPQDFDGTGLLENIQKSEPPLFRFNVQDVLDEVEKNVGYRAIEIPHGLHVRLENGTDAMVRIRRVDLNWPRYGGMSADWLAVDSAEFEAATYRLLRAHPHILASNLLYSRGPVQHTTDATEVPKDLVGRGIFVFEKAPGTTYVWPDNQEHKLAILSQCAYMRASLFRLELPFDFAERWLPLCSQNPKILPSGIAPIRGIAVDFLVSKVQEMIKNEGDMIGWESDHNVVGPIAASAKQSLLRLIPLILPADEDSDYYRLVLEHDDFGIHNMTITESDFLGWVDLELDGDGCPIVSRMDVDSIAGYIAACEAHARHYFKILDEHAPEYIPIIKAGKDARRIWFALKAWRGADPEEYFEQLGTWADRRCQELSSQ